MRISAVCFAFTLLIITSVVFFHFTNESQAYGVETSESGKTPYEHTTLRVVKTDVLVPPLPAHVTEKK